MQRAKAQQHRHDQQLGGELERGRCMQTSRRHEQADAEQADRMTCTPERCNAGGTRDTVLSIEQCRHHDDVIGIGGVPKPQPHAEQQSR